MITPYYQDEWVTLYCNKYENILPQLEDNSIALTVTDPPYQFQGGGGGFFGGWSENYDSKHKPRKYLDELEAANCLNFSPDVFLPSLKRVLKYYYGYFFCNKELVDIYIQYAKKNNLMFDILVMAKNNPLPACNAHHLRDLEYIVMLRSRGTNYYHSPDFDDNRKFYLVNTGGVSYHPAEKPVGFLMRMIKVSSREGETVLDPFSGSGSTLLAARELNRRSIGIDHEEKYLKIAVERLAQTRLFITGIIPSEYRQLELIGKE